jgi:hypothetical protein
MTTKSLSRRSQNADLPHDHAVPAHDDVCPICTRLPTLCLADHGVGERTAVDAAVGADLDVVLCDPRPICGTFRCLGPMAKPSRPFDAHAGVQDEFGR